MRAAGFSLVELMIASALGLLTVAVAGTLLLQGARSYREGNRVSRMHDELRFALAQLGQDLEMAGFYGEARDPARIARDPGLLAAPGGDCGPTTDGAAPGPANNWLFAETRASIFTRGDATATQANAAFPCISAAEFYAGPRGEGSDILALKRVSGSALAAGSRIEGHVYLETDGAQSVLYQYAAATHRPAVSAAAAIYEFRPAIWYLRRYSVSAAESPKIPALCRKVLVAAGGPHLQSDPGGCIAQGIEDLQLEFGLDTDGDGVADRYSAYGASPTADVLAQIVAVRVHLLARAGEADPAHLDSRTYRLAGRLRGPFNDRFHRRALSALALLRNPARLLAPPELPR